ncbi:hypothetical protein PHMEG_0004365 [Phytophthora megakarya]|uniref:Uncharacterized protein n=1 Tax=Phytophthora megakarya TaxID=4795 RepID=A0A225WVL8_9STRA|nr:hypothetical protein PHMEG_0004365 [Phytophthora megakarya]
MQRQIHFRILGPFAFIWNNLFSRKGFVVSKVNTFQPFVPFRGEFTNLPSIQMYQASNWLPRPRLNSLIVGLSIANCWPTATIQVFLPKAPALEQDVTLTYDALLSLA